MMCEAVTLSEFYNRLRGSYYVYALCDSDGTPFYIGKGQGDRIEAHESEARSDENDTPKHQVIREIWSRKARVGYKLLGDFSNEEEALETEKRLIAELGRRSNGTGVLTNLTDGGEGQTPDYSWQEWELDENGIRVIQQLERPGSEDFAPPRYRSINDAIVNGLRDDGSLAIEGWKEPEEYTGPEMPLVAQWQGHGLTVQAFFADSCDNFREYVLRDDYKKRIMQRWFNEQRWWYDKYMMSVVVRVLDGKRVIIQERSAFHARGFGPGLSTPRTPRPSKKRVATERRLTASILGRLADMAKEQGSKVRYDWRYSSKNLTKQTQAWFKCNEEALRKIALELDENHE